MQYPNLYVRLQRSSKGRVKVGLTSEGFDPITSVMGQQSYKYNTVTFEMDRYKIFKPTIRRNTAYNASCGLPTDSGLKLSPEQTTLVLDLYKQSYGLYEDCVLNIVYN